MGSHPPGLGGSFEPAWVWDRRWVSGSDPIRGRVGVRSDRVGEKTDGCRWDEVLDLHPSASVPLVVDPRRSVGWV